MKREWMGMAKTEDGILHVLGTSLSWEMDAFVPARQMHIWLHVNRWRKRGKLAPLDRLYFSRVLYRMRAKGLIERTYRASPCDGNMWVLVGQHDQIAATTVRGEVVVCYSPDSRPMPL